MNNFYSITEKPIKQEQQIIRKALSQGLNLFDEYCRTNSIKSQRLSSFFNAFLSYQKKIAGNHFLDNPDNFYTEQNKLYVQIYSPKNNFSDEIKVFLEFMLGLCRFYLSLKLFVSFTQYLHEHVSKASINSSDAKTCCCPHCIEGNSFWQLLHNMSILSKTRISELIDTTNNFQSIDFWNNAKTFFEISPKLKQLAKHIVSMQYIPEEKEFLGLMQILHFGGFAGSGILIRDYTQLQPLLAHRIGYHDKEQGGFNKRLSVILLQQNLAKEYANKIGIELISHKPINDPLSILDVGSGPTFAGTASIVNTLIKQDRKVELTVTEIDDDSLAKLKELQAELGFLTEVRYLDLNFVNQVPDANIVANKFDAISASLVLHQLDHQEILEAFKFFIKILKPGAYILNTDVGKDGYYQSLLVPANSVDREGHVIPWQEFDFKATSIPYSNNSSKIAYPMRTLIRGFPNEEQQLYVFVAYKILIIPAKDIDQLTMLWKRKEYLSADKLINQFCKT